MKRVILMVSALLIVFVAVVALYPDNLVVTALLQKKTPGLPEQSESELGDAGKEDTVSEVYSLSRQNTLTQASQTMDSTESADDQAQTDFRKEKAGRHDDYELNFTTGRAISGPLEERSKGLNIWPHELLSSMLKKFYRFNHETPDLRISARAKVSEKVYVGGGAPSSRQTRGRPELTTDNIPIDKKLLNCDWPESKKNESQECSMTFVGVFNIEKQSVIRIKDSLYDPENRSWQKRDILNIHDGIVNNKDVYYGCYPSYPINIADLNQDGVPEVAMFSSVGRDDIAFSYSGRPGAPDPERANATLYLSFLSAIHPDPYLLDTELVYNKYDYNKATGQRRYAKLYFADFDNNEKLDILVWRRFFNIKPGPENTINQELVKEAFEYYEEASPTYERQTISNEDGQKLLKERGWGWFDGFPSKNLCIAKDPWRHHAKPEIMQHGSIPTD